MRTIRDYFKDELDISVIRNIELNFFRLCTWNGCEQAIVMDMLDYLSTNMEVKWTRLIEEKPGNWNMTYQLSKGNKKLRIYVTSELTTELNVFDY